MLLQLFSPRSNRFQFDLFPLLPNSSSFQEFEIYTIWDHQRLKENVPQTHTVFQKLAHTKRARAASRSIREISSASGSTYAPPPSLTSTSGRCQVTDEASSCYAFQRRRRQIPAKVERRAFVVGDASSVIFVNASVTIFTL